MQPRTTERLNSQYQAVLGQVSRVQKAAPTAVKKECATPPHTHPTSRYVTACDKFYQAFPAPVLQVTNTGTRRSGYEANYTLNGLSHHHNMWLPIGMATTIMQWSLIHPHKPLVRYAMQNHRTDVRSTCLTLNSWMQCGLPRATETMYPNIAIDKLARLVWHQLGPARNRSSHS